MPLQHRKSILNRNRRILFKKIYQQLKIATKEGVPMNKRLSKCRRILACAALMLGAAVSQGSIWASVIPSEGVWVAGDFHQHTTYTDGSNSFKTVAYKNNQFGLDWWANSEHGGAFGTDARGPLSISGPYNVNGGYSWTDLVQYPSNPIFASTTLPPAGKMWRWQSLYISFNDTMWARGTYMKPILQSFEWNVPGHEHASVGSIPNQFSFDPDAYSIAAFEYLFDGNDKDDTWPGKNMINNHAKAVEGVTMLQWLWPQSSYVIFAHVERKGVGDPNYVGSGSKGYNISDFRDFNNAAPDVCFGFESMPGHQKEAGRGGYSSASIDGGTFGGTGAYAAKIGGLWDALLGEGRNWWLFASSDFHNTSADFWPGEYQKTYTKVGNPKDAQSIINGLRSGNSFVVEGDLIDGLEFTATSTSNSATMGQTLNVPNNTATISIRFRSPAVNNNGDAVNVDHIDLIAGDVTGRVAPGDPNYNVASNPSAHVIATFRSGDWTAVGDGWYSVQTTVQLNKDMYFRLRGTNLAPNTLNETDADGNPLSDTLMGPNDAAKAYQDLWFYSNPIFAKIQ
jgi:hypothetical protein